MQPQEPANVQGNGAPAQPPSTQRTTSRPAPDPTAVAAWRQAQSLNDRVTHVSNQLGTVTNVLQHLVNSQQVSTDEAFYGRLGEQLTSGEIDQATYTRRVAQRTAERVAAQTITPPVAGNGPVSAPAPPPAADPRMEVQRAAEYGKRAILQGLGLRGDEPGLDFSSPQALSQTGRRIIDAAQQQGAGGTLNVQDTMGEIARQQGYVIPHRDGGRPAGAHPQATEADLDAIMWDKRSKNAPQRKIAALQNVRDSLAARVPSVRTGEGLLGSPSQFREPRS